jgi:hypothetical protein
MNKVTASQKQEQGWDSILVCAGICLCPGAGVQLRGPWAMVGCSEPSRREVSGASPGVSRAPLSLPVY